MRGMPTMKPFTEESMKRELYRMYQLDWMSSNGYGIQEFFRRWRTQRMILKSTRQSIQMKTVTIL